MGRPGLGQLVQVGNLSLANCDKARRVGLRRESEGERLVGIDARKFQCHTAAGNGFEPRALGQVDAANRQRFSSCQGYHSRTSVAREIGGKR